MNRFSRILEQLPQEDLRKCLERLCDNQGLDDRESLECQMDRLERLGLALRHLMGWEPTWLAFGVTNWMRHQQAARGTGPLPQPRERENGQQEGPPCEEYRELYVRPGTCWCLRPQWQHPGQAAEIALQFLRQLKRG